MEKNPLEIGFFFSRLVLFLFGTFGLGASFHALGSSNTSITVGLLVFRTKFRRRFCLRCETRTVLRSLDMGPKSGEIKPEKNPILEGDFIFRRSILK